MKRDTFIEHKRIICDNPFVDINSEGFGNIILPCDSEGEKWYKETTEKIAEWRGLMTSAYIRWALSINGLYVTGEKYEEYKNKNLPNTYFAINSLRSIGSSFNQSCIAQWDWKTASQAHLATAPLMATYGFVDLYNCLEEFVFDIYRIYLVNNPDSLIDGKEYKHLRSLRNKKDNGKQHAEDWEAAFNERLNQWQRKKLYSGLGKVFISYCRELRLKTPSEYKNTTIDTWTESIDGISQIRNSIIHGSKTVSKELADFCEKPYNLGFSFKENDDFCVDLYHLQAFELFLNQLLSGINKSLVEEFMASKKNK